MKGGVMTLVIMAAGIGSRFGEGIKQLAPVGANGEIIMDYSIYDAIRAGFKKVVFIIRKDIEKEFKEVIGDRISKVLDVSYAYQELENIPKEYSVPKGRKKPWGTGQAVLSIKGIVNEPFAVINADDYYGTEGFKAIYDYLSNETQDNDVYNCCMAGFILKNTLSDNGGVSRGVCTVDNDGYLKNVVETFEIEYKNGELTAKDEEGNPVDLDSEQVVSMNMWGLPNNFLSELEKGFEEFLGSITEKDIKKEYLLPLVIDRCIKEKKAKVKVLKTSDKWFGVTYKEDKELVIKSIRELIKKGVYPEKLF
jgi:glucose-1-phosphate thymidylyltransferase